MSNQPDPESNPQSNRVASGSRVRSTIVNGLVIALAAGSILGFTLLLAMTMGAAIGPLLVVLGIFVVIGLQYVFWRALGLIGPSPDPQSASQSNRTGESVTKE